MGHRDLGNAEPLRLNEDDPLARLRALLAQQMARVAEAAGTLEARGDEAAADRLREQLAYAEGVLSGSPEDVERWGHIALLRGMLVDLLGRTEDIAAAFEQHG